MNSKMLYVNVSNSNSGKVQAANDVYQSHECIEILISPPGSGPKIVNGSKRRAPCMIHRYSLYLDNTNCINEFI